MQDEFRRAIGTVGLYLDAMAARDLDRARGCVADGALDLRFPGGRRFTRIEEIVANSGGRYARIGKTVTRRTAWAEGTSIHVLFSGTLHGQWPDGTPFDNIRFVDVFALEAGKIVRQEVWNDSGEWLLARRQAEAQAEATE